MALFMPLKNLSMSEVTESCSDFPFAASYWLRNLCTENQAKNIKQARNVNLFKKHTAYM